MNLMDVVQFLNANGGFVQTLCSIVLICVTAFYAWQTKVTVDIMAKSQREQNRPIILRSGFISSWNEVVFNLNEELLVKEPLSFCINRNIAKDISGCIIIDNKEYSLLFGNEISRVDVDKTINVRIDGQLSKICFTKTWGWMQPNHTIRAIYKSDEFKEIKAENCIYIEYFDISGNKYFTKESSNFSQVCGEIEQV